MNPPRHPRAPARAFTLIEIMVVIAIIGLILAMGMPSIIQAFKKEGLRKAIDQIKNVCNAARSDAILHDQTTTVYFYPQMQERRYQLGGAPQVGAVDLMQAHNTIAAAEDNSNTNAIVPTGAGGSGDERAGTLPDGVFIGQLDVNQMDFSSSAYGAVRFFPDGTCDEMVMSLHYNNEVRFIVLQYSTGMPQTYNADEIKSALGAYGTF